MAKQFEHTIRFKIILLCLTVVVTGCIFMFYIYHTGAHTEKQRQTNLQLQDRLELTGKLIQKVNESQSTANRIAGRNSKKEFRKYIIQADTIRFYADSLIKTNPFQADTLLPELNRLLIKQQRLLSSMQSQPPKENPVMAITEQIQTVMPTERKDSVFVIAQMQTQKQDTIVSKKPKKGFFKRLAAAFSPEKDSIVTLINHQRDTLVVAKTDSSTVLSAVDSIAKKASVTYEKQMSQIELENDRWISSNQEIAEQISALLLALHSEALDASLSMIQENEQTIRETYAESIIGGCIALTLILLFLSLILIDISQAKRARKALEAANESNLRLMESRHQLLLSVSHDMKTPLNTILGYLELRTNIHEEDFAMQHAAKYMQALLENLLEYSGLESGALQLTEKRFDAYLLFIEICELFVPVSSQKQLAFHPCYEAENPLYLEGDAVKIKQICINLLSNAFKYTKDGEVCFTVKYSDKTLSIEVSDTGIGIPCEQQKRIFTPFARLDQGRQMADGHGFGMSVVRGLTDLLDGKIELYSASGKGTRIYLHLPIRLAQKPLREGKKRIAVVDDDAAFRYMTCEMLTRLGHEAKGYDQPSAVEPADLILTDWEMKQFSGADVLKNASNIPVWVMTGKADFNLSTAYNLGFRGFIRKPFTLNDLTEQFGSAECSFESMLTEDEELLSKIRELFIDNTRKDLAELDTSFRENDFLSAGRICHKMIGMCGQMGYRSLTNNLRKIDQADGIPFDGWENTLELIIKEAKEILKERS